MIEEAFINKLKQKLKSDLPGEAAQYMMAPLQRKNTVEVGSLNERCRLSAVLLLVCEDNGKLFLPLIQRQVYSGVHSAQVSLPGGKYDELDGSLENTALRECYEEIGIKENIELGGGLTKLYIPVSNFLVQPYVGFCFEDGPMLLPHEREVKRIIRLPLEDLLKEELVKNGVIENLLGNKLKAPYFEIEGLQVWGATAMILNEFKAVLKSIY
jgi:8-oxo-dGTP pyrophosphatase MutT (NUDIX family)